MTRTVTLEQLINAFEIGYTITDSLIGDVTKCLNGGRYFYFYTLVENDVMISNSSDYCDGREFSRYSKEEFINLMKETFNEKQRYSDGLRWSFSSKDGVINKF
jgi:hypothetical protein